MVKLLYSFVGCVSVCSRVRGVGCGLQGRSLEGGGLGRGNSSRDEVMHESFRTDPFKVIQYGIMILYLLAGRGQVQEKENSCPRITHL